jgi:hypothetical protein
MTTNESIIEEIRKKVKEFFERKIKESQDERCEATV